jgi:hypothetical protein
MLQKNENAIDALSNTSFKFPNMMKNNDFTSLAATMVRWC